MRPWIVLPALLLAITGAGVASGGGLHAAFVADVRLPGRATRLDYQSIDPQKHLLFVAHLGDGNIIVFNTKMERVAAVIANVNAVHGVLAVPQKDTVFASATGTNEVIAVDERTLHVLWRVPGGTYPDGLAYEPSTQRLFVSDERGGTETVVDTKSHEIIATVALGGEAGNTQYDSVSHHIFVNVQTTQKLAEIDPRSNRILHRYSVGGTGCVGNHGLLIDSRRRRAFVACEDSNSFLWIDMRSMHVVQTWNVGDGPDVLALDTRSDRLFVATESGTVSVFLNEGRVTLLGQAFLAANAHSVAVDSRTQLAYFPLESVEGTPVLRIMQERP